MILAVSELSDIQVELLEILTYQLMLRKQVSGISLFLGGQMETLWSILLMRRLIWHTVHLRAISVINTLRSFDMHQ